MPGNRVIPPRMSLNLVVMVSWFSLSSWGDAPHSERLRAFKRTVCGSSNSRPGSYPARVSSTRRCAGRHSESNCLMIPIVVVAVATRCDRCACGCELDARICAISPRRNPGFEFRILAASNGKPPLRAPIKTGVEEAQRQVISVHVSARWLDLAATGERESIERSCE